MLARPTPTWSLEVFLFLDDVFVPTLVWRYHPARTQLDFDYSGVLWSRAFRVGLDEGMARIGTC